MLTKLSDTRRWVRLEGAANFRDLGGHRTRDGRIVRWGRLYRSDDLSRLTPSDVERLRHLGITSVIDLRSSAELALLGRFPVEQLPVRWHHLPLVEAGVREASGATSGRGGEREDVCSLRGPLGGRGLLGLTGVSLGRVYLTFAEAGRASLATSLRLLAREASYPAVVHCSAGKDRTGLLAALVLSLLGVDEDQVLADYEASASALPAITARMASSGTPAASLVAHPAAWSLLTVDVTALAEALRGLSDRYGSLTGFAAWLGLDERVLEGLADALLAEDPGEGGGREP